MPKPYRTTVGVRTGALLCTVVLTGGCAGTTTAPTTQAAGSIPSERAGSIIRPPGSAGPGGGDLGGAIGETKLMSGRPYGVKHSQRSFVDPSRKTPAGSQTPEQTGRTLVTELYEPEGGGPAPLIILSHGLAGHPDKLVQLGERWASAGYFVAVPAFPLTNDKVPGSVANARDVWDQPGDVSFTIDRLTDATNDEADPLHGHIDVNHIGAAGHSLGGATTYALFANDCCIETRLTTAVVFAGAALPMSGQWTFEESVPLMVIHGDKDLSLPLAGDHDAWSKAQGPRVFVTLVGGTHADPFEDSPDPFDSTVGTITTDWWDVHLLGAKSAQGVLDQDLDSAANVRVERTG